MRSSQKQFIDAGPQRILGTKQTMTRSPDKAMFPILQFELWVSIKIVIRNPKNLSLRGQSRINARQNAINSGYTKPTVLFQETRFSPSAYFVLLVCSRENFWHWFSTLVRPGTRTTNFSAFPRKSVSWYGPRPLRLSLFCLACGANLPVWFAAKVRFRRPIFRKFTMQRQIIIFMCIHGAPEYLTRVQRLKPRRFLLRRTKSTLNEVSRIWIQKKKKKANMLIPISRISQCAGHNALAVWSSLSRHWM